MENIYFKKRLNIDIIVVSRIYVVAIYGWTYDFKTSLKFKVAIKLIFVLRKLNNNLIIVFITMNE